MSVFLSACERTASALDLESLPEGDAGRGAALFMQDFEGAAGCHTCHRLDNTRLVGPGMQDFSQRAEDRVSGMSAEAYTLESITLPTNHIVNSYSNAMPRNYAEILTPQQIADLISYLLTL